MSYIAAERSVLCVLLIGIPFFSSHNFDLRKFIIVSYITFTIIVEGNTVYDFSIIRWN